MRLLHRLIHGHWPTGHRWAWQYCCCDRCWKRVEKVVDGEH